MNQPGEMIGGAGTKKPLLLRSREQEGRGDMTNAAPTLRRAQPSLPKSGKLLSSVTDIPSALV